MDLKVLDSRIRQEYVYFFVEVYVLGHIIFMNCTEKEPSASVILQKQHTWQNSNRHWKDKSSAFIFLSSSYKRHHINICTYEKLLTVLLWRQKRHTDKQTHNKNSENPWKIESIHKDMSWTIFWWSFIHPYILIRFVCLFFCSSNKRECLYKMDRHSMNHKLECVCVCEAGGG